MDPAGSEQYDLEEGTEWRFELEENEAIAVRVLSDSPVFINYQELPPNTWYPLYGELKAAIWSPSPSKIEVTTAPSTCYTSHSSTYPFLLSLHLALERLRILARRNHRHAGPSEHAIGPRVMVMGPSNCGKTTAVKSLVNLALGGGMGWSVGVAGLDPGNPLHLVPGSISLATPTQALPTHHPYHFLGSPPTTAPAVTLSSDVSTVAWWLGSSQLSNTKTSFPLWKKLVEQLGETWNRRCAQDEACQSSGLIIDTPASFTTPGLGTSKGDRTRYGIARHAMETLKVNVLLVIGNEKLAIEMEKLMGPVGVHVIRVPKSSGVVDVEEGYHLRVQSLQTKSYFYGEAVPKSLQDLPGRTMALEAPLHPYAFVISWDDLEIYRVGQEAAAPSSALPIGMQTVLSPTRLTKVDPSTSANVHRLQNTLLALVNVSEDDRLGDAKTTVATSDAMPTQEGKQEADATGTSPEVKKETEIASEDEEDNEAPRWAEAVGWHEVVGFLTITNVDAAKRKFSVLAPSPGRLPSKVAIAGSLEWVEDE